MKKILSTVLCLICCCSVAAQTPLALDECKLLARENNIAMRTAQNSLQQAEQQQKQAFTNYFPQLSAMGGGMTANKHLMQMDLPAELSAMAAMLPAGATMPTSIGMVKHGIMGSVSAMQPVFAGGQIVNGNKLAQLGVEVSRIQLEASADEVELATEWYYWQVVSLKEKLTTLGSLQRMLEQLEKDVTVSVHAGVTTRNDLLQVQLKVNEVESQTVQVQNALAICLQLLAQHVGKSGEDIDVAERVPYADSLLLPLRHDHLASLASTSQYRLMERNVEASRLQLKMKIGENLPAVSAGAVYTYNDLMGDGRGVGMLIATVSVPISGWWGGSHAIRKQRLALDNARMQLTDASEKLVINMDNCWASVETCHRQLAIARKSIAQSEENLRLNNDYYRAGTTTMSDLLDAQSSYQQSRDKYVDAYIDYQVNLLKYQQATGTTLCFTK
ncbi:MAG: TolC family protein [Prevotella sp.]|nr:TolC family protein [Prevotella sp.]